MGRCLDDSLIDINDQQEYGFPISQQIWTRMTDQGLFLGRTVRNAATVSLKSEKLKRNFDETMIKLYYRAVFQVLVLDNQESELRHKYTCGRRAKRVKNMKFKDYCKLFLPGQSDEVLDTLQ